MGKILSLSLQCCLRHFGSDSSVSCLVQRTLPLALLIPKVDVIYGVVCIHCNVGSVIGQQILLCIQLLCASLFVIGYQTRIMSAVSWWLYLSLSLRNTWLNFILDRYFHYLLFYSMFLPLDHYWSVSSSKANQKDTTNHNAIVMSLATIAIKLQVLWIYMDAGVGKYMDPLGGWTYNADPLPALDTYARHTVAARYLYALLGPQGLRLLTPTVVYVEILSGPIALLGSFMGWNRLVIVTVGTVCLLHIGIALTVRNTVLLSLVACSAWIVYLPISYEPSVNATAHQSSRTSQTARTLSRVFILSMIAGSLWFETLSEECNQSMKHIWSTLLHNRWNVFVGAEEYVTWEIAPGRLADGSVIDVWGRTEHVNWKMPGAGAPSTSTSRPGRWRSFPYMAELEGEDGKALWSYLCREWDEENNVANNPGRALLRFNFFMLQADVLPNMGFSATRKRLIKSFECRTTNGTQAQSRDPERDVDKLDDRAKKEL